MTIKSVAQLLQNKLSPDELTQVVTVLETDSESLLYEILEPSPTDAKMFVNDAAHFIRDSNNRVNQNELRSYISVYAERLSHFPISEMQEILVELSLQRYCYDGVTLLLHSLKDFIDDEDYDRIRSDERLIDFH